MNLYHLHSFDESLADSVKLAEIRRVTQEAMEYAGKKLGKVREPKNGLDAAIVYAMNAGMLEGVVENLCAYLAQIAITCKPDRELIPHLDDLGAA